MTCQGGTSTIGGGLALGTPLKAFIRHESSTDASYILVVFRPSHNVVASQNIIID